jgi:hypothetical protein
MAEHRLTLPMCPSANVAWRPAPGRGLVPSGPFLAFKAEVKTKYAALMPLWGPIRASWTIYRGSRMGDLSNRLKPAEDALNGLAYLDDSQMVEHHLYRLDDPERPRIEVVLVGERFATIDETIESRVKAAAKAGRMRRTRRLNKLESYSRSEQNLKPQPLPEEGRVA